MCGNRSRWCSTATSAAAGRPSNGRSAARQRSRPRTVTARADAGAKPSVIHVARAGTAHDDDALERGFDALPLLDRGVTRQLQRGWRAAQHDHWRRAGSEPGHDVAVEESARKDNRTAEGKRNEQEWME